MVVRVTVIDERGGGVIATAAGSGGLGDAIGRDGGVVGCKGAALVAPKRFEAVPNITLSADAADAEFEAGGMG